MFFGIKRRIKNMKDKIIGWIGAGIMGAPMCGHLLEAGYEVFVYDYFEKNAKKLEALGAKLCGSPMEIAEKSDIICTMVGTPTDIQSIMFGETGIFLTLKKGSYIIDFTSSTPELAKEIARKARVLGAHALDAPVTGGESGAKGKLLSIMIGGALEDFETVKSFIEQFGAAVTYMGESGAGQHTKIAGQILGAATMMGVSESLIYTKKANLDMKKVISVLEKGSVGSWLYSNLAPKIADYDFMPGFSIKHFLKDIGIALDESKRMDLSLPGLALAWQMYIASGAMELGNDGIHGLYKVYENLNCIEKK